MYMYRSNAYTYVRIYTHCDVPLTNPAPRSLTTMRMRISSGCRAGASDVKKWTCSALVVSCTLYGILD